MGRARFRARAILALGASLVVGLACASPFPPPPPPVATHDGYRYENPSLGVALGFPSRWRGFASRAEAPPGYESMLPRFKSRNSSPLFVALTDDERAFARLLVEPVPEGASATEYFGRLHLGLGNTVETIAVAAASERDTVRWEYQVQQGALDMRFVEYVTVAGGTAYRLGFWSLGSLVSQYTEEFASIAGDFLVHRDAAWQAPWIELDPLLDEAPYAHMQFAEPLGPSEMPVCAPGAHSLRWQVTTPTATLHLYGSVHFGRPEFYPLSDETEAAFAESDTLVVELDLSDPRIAAEIEAGTAALMLPDGTTLDDVLSEDVYEQVAASLASLGLDPDAFGSLSPGLLGVTLLSLKSLSLGYQAELGVDRYFLGHAGDRDIVSLETASQQIELIAALDEEWVLEGVLHDIERMDETALALIAAWRCGDREGLEAALFGTGESGSPEALELRKRTFSDRNVQMAGELVRLLERGGTFFVVTGVGHMIGADGIPTLLEELGYPVEAH